MWIFILNFWGSIFVSKNSVVQSGRFTTHVGGSGGMPDLHRHCGGGGGISLGEIFQGGRNCQKKTKVPGRIYHNFTSGIFHGSFSMVPGRIYTSGIFHRLFSMVPGRIYHNFTSGSFTDHEISWKLNFVSQITGPVFCWGEAEGFI